MKKVRQVELRFVVNKDRDEEFRRYAQSTSGRICSQATTPEDSRSMEMQMDSPMDCLADMAFRKYPTEVPHLLANSNCPSVDSEFRYVRSASMPHNLPLGNYLSIPSGHLPRGKDGYRWVMDVYEIRRLRLIQLVNDTGGNKKLADLVTESRRSPMAPDYISRCISIPSKKGHKRVTAEMAEVFETAGEKPKGWLSEQDDSKAEVGGKKTRQQEPYWPFSIPLEIFESLPISARRQLDQSFTDLALSAHAREANAKKKKHP